MLDKSKVYNEPNNNLLFKLLIFFCIAVSRFYSCFVELNIKNWIITRETHREKQ